MPPLLPLVVAVVGLAFYGFANGKISEIGRLTFFAGLLALLLQASPKLINL